MCYVQRFSLRCFHIFSHKQREFSHKQKLKCTSRENSAFRTFASVFSRSRPKQTESRDHARLMDASPAKTPTPDPKSVAASHAFPLPPPPPREATIGGCASCGCDSARRPTAILRPSPPPNSRMIQTARLRLCYSWRPSSCRFQRSRRTSMICIPSLPRTKRAAFAMARHIGRDAAALIASPDVAHQPSVQRMKPLPLLAAKLRAPPHRTHKAPSRAVHPSI